MKVGLVASGDIDDGDLRHLDDAGMIVAADGGAAALERDGRRIDLLVGDLDSADADLVERLASRGTRVERHPADKDASDTELALAAAIAAGADEVVILGALGGRRLDHELANLLLLSDPDLANRRVRIVRGPTTVRALRAPAALDLDGSVGSFVTLLPIGGDVDGAETTGLRWPLAGGTLRMGRSRGLSNEVVALPASVRIGRGTLLVVETHSIGADHP
jgi:thiamine pyrophosphokinase